MREHVISQIHMGPYKRLGWYRDKWAVSDWHEHVWQHVDTASIERLVLSLRRKKTLLRAFIKYLPPKGRIIEAGCGLGHWVNLLKTMGYEIQGVEIGEPTVRRAKEFFPDAPLSVADIRCLPFPGASFDAYLSLGVVEHTEDGPEPALLEARRVLAPRGVLLCAVPFFNALRKLRRRPSGRPPDLDFYQWSFLPEEFNNLLQKTGFEVRQTIPYDTFKTLTDELPFVNSLKRTIAARTNADASAPGGTHPRRPNPGRLRLISRYFTESILETRPFQSCAGHMCAFIAFKK